MNITADFHLHTNESDGKLAPEELVRLAKKEGLAYIAVTDHDTTGALERALKEANSQGIVMIPGIELSTQHNKESIHVLGFFKDASYTSPAFQHALEDMKNYRLWRAKKIIENLDTYFNIKLDYEKILTEAHGVIARPHIARAIVSAGFNYDWEYIFDKLIGKDSPAYIPNKKLSTVEGIKLLRSVNAVLVLAHPVLIKKTEIEEFMKMDLDGIEAIYFQNSDSDTEKFLALAKEYNKLVTGGSDYHGGDSGDAKHGYIGSIEYPRHYLEKFLSAVNK